MDDNQIPVPKDLLLQLRRDLPRYPITYSQGLLLAEVLARRLRRKLGIRSTRMPFDWVQHVPNVALEVVTIAQIQERIQAKAPERAGERASGLTERADDGDYRIAVSKRMSHTHRRFTLAHELAHLITFEHAHAIFSRLGHGDKDLRAYRIERICDHFAAELLMPAALVRKAWQLGIQGTAPLAAEFGVSEDAINIRIRDLELVDDEPDRPVAAWFRMPCASSDGLH